MSNYYRVNLTAEEVDQALSNALKMNNPLDSVKLKDQVTGKIYTIQVHNGQLMMIEGDR